MKIFDLNNLNGGGKHNYSPYLEEDRHMHYIEDLSKNAILALNIIRWVIEAQDLECDYNYPMDVPIPLGKPTYDEYFEENPPIENCTMKHLRKGIKELKGIDILCNSSINGEYYYNHLCLTRRAFEELFDEMASMDGPFSDVAKHLFGRR